MWAFSDESERANTLIISVVIGSPLAIRNARGELHDLLLPGQRRIHTSDESARRRRLVLDTIGRLEAIDATALCLRRPAGLSRVDARSTLLHIATQLVAARRVVAWTLDDQDAAQLARDRATIAGALRKAGTCVPLTYDHRPSSTDPALWIADAVCWAVGAGRDWRRRIDPVLTVEHVQP
jgi:hypothetical protein